MYKISDSYDSITVYTTHGESDTQKVEVPSSKTTLSAAIYITDNKTLSHANITEYIASEQADNTDTSTDATSTDATNGQGDAATDAATQPTDTTATDAQTDAAAQSTDPNAADQTQAQPADGQQPVVTQ